MNAHDFIYHIIKLGGPFLTARMEYEPDDAGTGTRVKYAAVAQRGSATSDLDWQIWRLTYETGTDDVILIESSLKEKAWDDRAVETYA